MDQFQVTTTGGDWDESSLTYSVSGVLFKEFVSAGEAAQLLSYGATSP